jgi:hypothetical protein
LEELSSLGARGGGVPTEYEVGDEEIEMLSETADLGIPSKQGIRTETVKEKESRPLIL